MIGAKKTVVAIVCRMLAKHSRVVTVEVWTTQDYTSTLQVIERSSVTLMQDRYSFEATPSVAVDPRVNALLRTKASPSIEGTAFPFTIARCPSVSNTFRSASRSMDIP